MKTIFFRVTKHIELYADSQRLDVIISLIMKIEFFRYFTLAKSITFSGLFKVREQVTFVIYSFYRSQKLMF